MNFSSHWHTAVTIECYLLATKQAFKRYLSRPDQGFVFAENCRGSYETENDRRISAFTWGIGRRSSPGIRGDGRQFPGNVRTRIHIATGGRAG
jgi:hypothetical protein